MPSADADVFAQVSGAHSLGGIHRVVNANGGKCLNTKDNSTSSGALVQQNSCDSVATKQWRPARPR
ncbi:RICIN domain-containing protein [Streptosporangium sp. NPDC002607]